MTRVHVISSRSPMPAAGRKIRKEGRKTGASRFLCQRPRSARSPRSRPPFQRKIPFWHLFTGA